MSMEVKIMESTRFNRKFKDEKVESENVTSLDKEETSRPKTKRIGHIKYASRIVIRSGPNRESEVIGTLDWGNKVVILEHLENKGYYKIETESGMTGFVNTAYCEEG